MYYNILADDVKVRGDVDTADVSCREMGAVAFVQPALTDGPWQRSEAV